MIVMLISNESKIASISWCGEFNSFSLLIVNEDEIGEIFVRLFCKSSIYIIVRKKKSSGKTYICQYN